MCMVKLRDLLRKLPLGGPPKPPGPIEPLWEKMSIPDVLDDLLSWGYGTGEEFLDFLETTGLPAREAEQIVRQLQRAMEGYRKKVEDLLT